MPFPQMLKIMIVPRAITAKSQLLDALETAEGAKDNPMQMMIGPVTTGGRNLMTFLTPISLITSAKTRYSTPATTMPPQA